MQISDFKNNDKDWSDGVASIRLQVTCYKSPSPLWGLTGQGEGWSEGSQFLDLKFELYLEFGFLGL